MSCVRCARIGLALLGVGVLVGCGGTAAPRVGASGAVRLTIVWPDRSRLIPAASNSIRATFLRAGIVLQSQVLSRPSSGNQTSATFTNLKTGPLTLTAVAYPGSDATGVAQARGTTPVTILAGQVANVSMTMASTIDHMELSPGAAAILAGQSCQMTATAKDASGSVVLTWPSNIRWDTADHGKAVVDSSGLVSGVSTGGTHVTVTETESGKSASILVAVYAPTLIAADNFDYTAGSELSGQSGGVGWSTPWSYHGSGSLSVVADTGLTYANLLTSGLSARTTSGDPIGDDRFVANQVGKPGTTLFFSLLVRPIDPPGTGNNGGYFGIVFANSMIGYSSALAPYYGIEQLGGGGPVASTVQVRQNVTALLVVRMTFTAANTIIDLFVNPTPGQPLPATPDVTKTDMLLNPDTQFGWGASTRCQFDEYRIGQTWEDVSPTM